MAPRVHTNFTTSIDGLNSGSAMQPCVVLDWMIVLVSATGSLIREGCGV